MFWRFGFSSTSSLDTLLDRPNVSLEEILDEDELLQECKTQNAKLVNYLQQPRVLKRLFEHVVGTAEVGGPGGREWEEKVRFKYPYIASEVLSSDIWSIIDTALSHSDDLLVMFWDAILSRGSTANPPTVTQHQHPLFSADAPPTAGFKSRSNSPHGYDAHMPTVPGGADITNGESSSVGVLGLEVKGNDDGNTVTSARDNGPGKSVLAGYWAKVNGVFLDKKPREMISFIREIPQVVELFVAHMETPAVVDLLYRIIQCEEAVPNIGVIDWLSSQELMPRLIDLLSPTHSTDLHNTVSELLKAIIALSAPSPASLTQGAGTEAFGFGGDAGNNQANGQVGGVNNRLVRELASEAIVRKMVSFMLDASLSSRLSRRLSEAADERTQSTSDATIGLRNRPSVVGANRSKLSALDEATSSSDDSALEDDELEFETGMSRRPLNPRDTPASEQSPANLIGGLSDRHRDSTATIRPSADSLTPVQAPEIAVSPESCTSTLVTCIGVLIELIRKNNSDYFEQHLFHTLRTHLLQRQQEIAERKANKTAIAGEANDEDSQNDLEGQQGQTQIPDEDDDDEMEGMEEAMAELSDKLGIVHLGPMLRVLCERLSDFQELVAQPRVDATTKIVNSVGVTPALTFERYRITELYAELLHCSNMALLNRQPGEGPQYSDEGVLQGGIEGLQILARTLQGTDGASESGQDHSTAERGEKGEDDEEGAHPKAAEGSNAPEHGSSTLPKEKEESPGRKAGARHTRESSTTGGVGSEDTDDEALLSEVSLSEAGNDAEGNGRTATAPSTTDTATTAPTSSSPTSKASDIKKGGDEDDEIKSVLSHLSLADLTTPSPAPSGPPSPMDDGRTYVVGDLLKKKFLECDVIPTILSLFFSFPWNNFLHNVVYDILQQFFNGRMDVGLNRRLTLAVFEQGGLPEKIVTGHRRNEESLQAPRRIRMGYMGHMHLIAEETVKLLERYPQEILRFVQPYLTEDWTLFVSETLKENREREAGPLAGGRPQIHSLAFPQHGGMGGGLSDGDVDNGSGLAGQSANSEPFASYLSSQMGGTTASDDDDSDEDSNWLSQDMRLRGSADNRQAITSSGGFDDAFAPSGDSFGNSAGGFHSTGNDDNDDDDDDWGPFADSSESAVSSAQAYQTPADLAADFQRKASASDGQPRPFDDGDEVEDDDDDDEAVADDSSSSTTSGNDVRTLGVALSSRARSDSGSSEGSGAPFVDLLDNASVRATDVVAAAHARRPSLGQYEGVAPAPESLRISRPRGLSDGSSATTSAAEGAPAGEGLLGPGVSLDAQHDPVSGMIERVIDGETVKAPLDEVALGVSSPVEASTQESAVADD